MKAEIFSDDKVWCDHCKCRTKWRFTSAGHERDSSGDCWNCTVCDFYVQDWDWYDHQDRTEFFPDPDGSRRQPPPRIFGSGVIVNKIIAPDTTYSCADSEFVGVMPVLQEIEVLPSDEPRRQSIGWKVEEIIGMAVVCPPETPESKQLRETESILACRLFKKFEGDFGWVLMQPPVIKTNLGHPDADYMPSYKPDYTRIAYGTPVLQGKKGDLELVQQMAQAVADLAKQKREQPGLFKKLRELTGL